MKVEILDEAERDMIDGFDFYEAQAEGLGDYFLDSLYSDIDSLQLYAGIHPLHSGQHRLLSSPSIRGYRPCGARQRRPGLSSRSGLDSRTTEMRTETSFQVMLAGSQT